MPYVMPPQRAGRRSRGRGIRQDDEPRQTWMTTASIGPGSLNMVTGTATATVQPPACPHLPPTSSRPRIPDPVLQQLEDPTSLDVTVNDAFRPRPSLFRLHQSSLSS